MEDYVRCTLDRSQTSLQHPGSDTKVNRERNHRSQESQKAGSNSGNEYEKNPQATDIYQMEKGYSPSYLISQRPRAYMG